MKRRLQIFAVAIGLAVRVGAADPVQIDPALVGTWKTEGTAASGPWTLVWEVAADGHYAVSGSVSDRGTILACKGKLRETSGRTGRVMEADYSWKSPNALATSGRLSFAWKRISKPKTEIETGPCRAPTQYPAALTNVPAQAGKAAAYARDKWRKDAALVWIEVRSLFANNQRYGYGLDFTFKSPSTKGGLILSPSSPPGQRARPIDGRALPDDAVPAAFIDLPAALDASRQHGLTSALNRAMLRVHQPPRHAPILAWEIFPEGGEPFDVDASGARFLGRGVDLDGVIAAYNETWEQAAQGFKAAAKALAPPAGGASRARPDCKVSEDLDCHNDDDVCSLGTDWYGREHWTCCNWWMRCEVRK